MSDVKAGRWVTLFVAIAALSSLPAQAFPILESNQPVPIEDNRNENPSPGNGQAEPEQQARLAPDTAITDLLTKIASLLEAPEGKETAKRSQRDLQAQENMARYALWMAGIAAVQAVLTIVGILLVWRTLAATKAATEAAAKAAEAADDAVVVTREIGQKQVRAYVSLIDVKISGIKPGGKPKVVINIMNGGQSPAISLGQHSEFRITGKDHRPKIDKTTIRQSLRSRLILPNGRTKIIELASDDSIDESICSRIMNGDLIIYCYVLIFYKDVFDVGRRCFFRMFMDLRNMKDGEGEFAFCQVSGVNLT